MNLLQVIKHLQGIALTVPNIRSANEGSVYTIQNGNPHQKYMSFVVSQTQHRTDELFDYFGLNLFLIDRLTDELEENRLQIQSLAKDCLTNILIKFCNKFYGATYDELVFHPFTEKFTDLCAGQYVQVTLKIPKNIICEDEYSTEYTPYKVDLKPLVVEISENGVYEYSPVADFDGYDSVTLTINVPHTGYTQEDLDNAYESGVTSGETYQKSLLSAITITENGEYTSTNGYSAVTVNVPQSAYTSGYTQEDLDNAYESGITSGETYQKSLLQDIEITHNGEYQVENGYDKVTVNVPQTGQTIYNQTKNIEYSGNGEYTITYDEGYTGLEGVNITVNVPQSAYTSGYTQEDLDNAYESGVTSGETYQKSLLSAITITNNGNYTSTNGYSAVTVNVDTNAWYQSGKTDGIAEQKSKLSAITITENGDYTRANGYSAVTVNVDTNAWYESGYTDGYMNGDEGEPLTFECLSAGTINWVGNSVTIYYSKNGGELVEVNPTPTGTPITVQSGDIVRFYGNLYYSGTSTYAHFDTGNLPFMCYGNVNSLLSINNYRNIKSIAHINAAFTGLFMNCDRLRNHPQKNIVLPATTLGYHSYQDMFNGCTALTRAPELPATTLTNGCYQAMFRGCTQLYYLKAMFIYGDAANLTYWIPNTTSGLLIKNKDATWDYDAYLPNWIKKDYWI